MARFNGIPVEQSGGRWGGKPVGPESIYETVMRRIGLTGRHALEGLGGAAGIVVDPITEALRVTGNQQGAAMQDTFPDMNMTQTYRGDIPSGREVGGMAANSLNLPSPETGTERVIGDATEILAGGGGLMAPGKILAKGSGRAVTLNLGRDKSTTAFLPDMTNKVTAGVGERLMAAPIMQGATAASAGVGGGLAKEKGLNPASQLMASLVAGLTPVGAKALATKMSKAFTQMAPEVDEIVTTLDLKGVATSVIQNIRERVNAALKTGNLDKIQLKRLADYAKTNTTATQAGVTLDPVTITQQKNLAKIGASSRHPEAQRLAQVENQNAIALIEQLDDLAKGTPLDLTKGGAAVADVISKRNKQLTAFQSWLYKKAKELHGGDIQLDKTAFANLAKKNIEESGRGTFLPAEIKAIVEEIADGTRPFSVSTIDELETILATAMKRADGNTRMAIGAVKKAVLETQPVSGLSGETMAAYRTARNFSRKMYAWRDKIPAIRAIIDGVEPDSFMKTYILSGTDKASAGRVKSLMNQIRGDKEATAIVKNQVAAWIKDKAQAGNADELVKLSAKSLANAIKSLGDAKLNTIFTKAEVSQLKAIARVASYESAQPVGSAVNNSNSATTATGMLVDWMARIGRGVPGAETVVTALTRRKDNIDAAASLVPNIGGAAQEGAPLVAPLVYGSATP